METTKKTQWKRMGAKWRRGESDDLTVVKVTIDHATQTRNKEY